MPAAPVVLVPVEVEPLAPAPAVEAVPVEVVPVPVALAEAAGLAPVVLLVPVPNWNAPTASFVLNGGGGMMASPPVVVVVLLPVVPVEVEPVVPALALDAGDVLLAEVAPTAEVDAVVPVAPVVLPVAPVVLPVAPAVVEVVQDAEPAPAPVLATGAALADATGLVEGAVLALTEVVVVVLAGALDVLAVPPPQAASTSKAPVAAGRRSLVMNFSEAMCAML